MPASSVKKDEFRLQEQGSPLYSGLISTSFLSAHVEYMATQRCLMKQLKQTPESEFWDGRLSLKEGPTSSQACL